MGVRFSKNSTSDFHPSNQLEELVMKFESSQSSYVAAAAHQYDSDLQRFHDKVQSRTGEVINNHVSHGIEVQDALPLDSLKEATNCLLEMNDEAFKVILDCKEDILENQELFELIEEFFDCSSKTIDFCTAVERCLRKARESHLIIQVALQDFEEEDGIEKNKKYLKTLEDLKDFKEAGDPFTEDILKKLKSVYMNRVKMLEKLESQMHKLDKKLQHVKTWKKVSSIILISTSATLLICSVLVAALAAPPVAAAVVGAIPLVSIRRWFDSLFNRYEDELMQHKKVIKTMHFGTRIAIKDLDNIRVLIDQLEEEIKSLFQNADFALQGGEEAVKIGVAEITKKLGVFKNSIEGLSEMVDRCTKSLIQSRTVLTSQMVKHPNDQ